MKRVILTREVLYYVVVYSRLSVCEFIIIIIYHNTFTGRMGICRGISFVCVYNALLLVLHGKDSSADGLSDIVKGLVNDHGQVTYLGRTIHYSSRGRVHSLKEPWVYDATAWDVESGTSVKKRHFNEAEEATRKAIETLILELKQKGIITDEPLNDGVKPTPKPASDILETPDDRQDDHHNEIPEGDGSKHPGGNLDSSGDESRHDGAKPTPKPPDILETLDDRQDDHQNKIPEGDGSKHPGNLDSSEDKSRQELSESWWYQEIFQTHPFAFGVVSATVIGCIGLVLMQCTSQTRVRSIGSTPETGASRRMINELAAKKKIANIINQSTPDLCKFLTIDDAFLRELLAEEVITDEEKDIIKATPIRGHKVEIVLEIVKNSTATGGYDRFMELLKGNRTMDLYQMVKKIEKQSGL